MQRRPGRVGTEPPDTGRRIDLLVIETSLANRAGGSEVPVSSHPTSQPEPNEQPSACDEINLLIDRHELPTPALGGPGHGVVQVSVEEDMPIGCDGQPVNEAATDQYHLYLPRTILMITTAVISAVLLAIPVIWGLAELLTIAGVIGIGVWAWVVLAIALIVSTVVIGVWTAQKAL